MAHNVHGRVDNNKAEATPGVHAASKLGMMTIAVGPNDESTCKELAKLIALEFE